MAAQIKSIPESVRIVMAQGYSYSDAMESYSQMGDNPEWMMNYLWTDS